MQGKLLKISGKNLTFQDQFGRNITLPVEKDHLSFLDSAIENLGTEFVVATVEGKIVDMKIVSS